MKFTSVNEVKIYNVNTGKTLPNWLSDRQKRRLLQNDSELRQRIQLLQDFDFPCAATRIKMSPNQQYIMATGVYKPRVRCYETAELAMKFERHMDSEVVQFQILSEDYRKMVFLQADRHVEMHAAYGRYFRTRIPKFGRDLAYHHGTCELYMAASGNEIYRLNLDQGQFMASLQGGSREYNVVKINPVHQFVVVGSIDGRVEAWDPRSRERIGVLDIPVAINEGVLEEITALRFHHDGLSLGVGTSGGQVLLYDVRANRPMLTKDHQYGYPIKDLKFHTSGRVISTDTKVVKIWERNTGDNFTSIEPSADINDVCVAEGSGLIMTANEDKDMNAYYIPDLGPAPKWCHFLDNITEELQETEQGAVYDDYKFVTRSELEALGLGHLLGSKLLRAYMHGYFMDIRLYNKAKAIAEPFAYDKYRKQKVQQKIEEKSANRIGVVKKLPKLNKEYAQHLLTDKKKKRKNEPEPETNPLQDDRFAALWKNPDFAVDTRSEEFKQRHPKAMAKDIVEQFSEVEDEESEPEGRPSDEEDSDEEETYEDRKKAKPEPTKKAAQKGPKMFELKEGVRFSRKEEAIKALERIKAAKKTPLGQRLEKEAVEPVTHSSSRIAGKTHMLKLEPKRDLKKEAKDQALKEHMKERRELRRGVKELKLKKRGPVYWRGQRVEAKK
eukprot:comp17635_c0_seq1/m.17381 comp17635_c0_seq1/g.17381  ORF comp17635_c0_seq1/g.17381 comp17635_c0_seq1/m.17381 type:complete len:668 (-) comp17635_c0_seq1:63-2066(-)